MERNGAAEVRHRRRDFSSGFSLIERRWLAGVAAAIIDSPPHRLGRSISRESISESNAPSTQPSAMLTSPERIKKRRKKKPGPDDRSSYAERGALTKKEKQRKKCSVPSEHTA